MPIFLWFKFSKDFLCHCLISSNISDFMLKIDQDLVANVILVRMEMSFDKSQSTVMSINFINVL